MGDAEPDHRRRRDKRLISDDAHRARPGHQLHRGHLRPHRHPAGRRTLLPGDTFPIAGYSSSQGYLLGRRRVDPQPGSTGNMLVLDSNATLAGTWKAFSFGGSLTATAAAQIAGAQVTLRASRDSAAAAQRSTPPASCSAAARQALASAWTSSSPPSTRRRCRCRLGR